MRNFAKSAAFAARSLQSTRLFFGTLCSKELGDVCMRKNVPATASLAGMTLTFIYMRSFGTFRYSSVTITLKSAFILGLLASRSNPVKANCDM